MLSLEKQQQIFLLFYGRNYSQRRIAKELTIGRDTVARYINKYKSLIKDIPQGSLDLDELWCFVVVHTKEKPRKPKTTWLTKKMIERIKYLKRMNYTEMYLYLKEHTPYYEDFDIQYSRFHQVAKKIERGEIK